MCTGRVTSSILSSCACHYLCFTPETLVVLQLVVKEFVVQHMETDRQPKDRSRMTRAGVTVALLYAPMTDSDRCLLQSECS